MQPGERQHDVPGSILVRDARMADRYAIGALWRELMTMHRALDPRFVIAPEGEERYIRHVHDMMRTRNARVLVAEATALKTPVGFLMGELQSRPPMALPGLYGFVSDIYVAEAWRRSGVGRALVQEMMHWFRLRKAQAIELYVAEANPEALAFWEAMGLRPFLRLMHHDF